MLGAVTSTFLAKKVDRVNSNPSLRHPCLRKQPCVTTRFVTTTADVGDGRLGWHHPRVQPKPSVKRLSQNPTRAVNTRFSSELSSSFLLLFSVNKALGFVPGSIHQAPVKEALVPKRQPLTAQTLVVSTQSCKGPFVLPERCLGMPRKGLMLLAAMSCPPGTSSQ